MAKHQLTVFCFKTNCKTTIHVRYQVVCGLQLNVTCICALVMKFRLWGKRIRVVLDRVKYTLYLSVGKECESAGCLDYEDFAL